MTQPIQQISYQHGIVKKVISGDTVIIRGKPKGGPPPEKKLGLSNIVAPKLAWKNKDIETHDEPWAWESREFLRKKLVGEEVIFTVENKVTNNPKEYGNIFLGKDISTSQNIAEVLISEGLAEVKKDNIKQSSEVEKLKGLEEIAKKNGLGKWKQTNEKIVRNIVWCIDDPKMFLEESDGRALPAVIEHVQDGSTVHLFLLPEFYYIIFSISGIKAPMLRQDDDQPAEFAEEAKYFTESRLLQRDVEVVLEGINKAGFSGTILHPNGNIAEALLKNGLARCDDWSIVAVTGGAEKLRTAEKYAKENKLRLWKNFSISEPQLAPEDKEFVAKVIEVIHADALLVKLADGKYKKIYLASIRSPKLSESKQDIAKSKNFRQLYDIPYMYEAREFLRKKLIGKKVNVSVDFVQPPSATFPEKLSCSITIGGINVAEVLVAKGFATVIRYRQNELQRASNYDDLLAAEMKAQKSLRGLHSVKEAPVHRMADISGDISKAKQFLPFLQRMGRNASVVEFVASGSRLRLYVPKDSCLLTLSLSGISCPKPQRLGLDGKIIDGEPWGDEALQFTRELCMQRDVEIEVESIDRAGNFLGWLWIDNQNLSVILVQKGLAKMHFSAERSMYASTLQAAEESAKQNQEKLWIDFDMNEAQKKELLLEEKILERKLNYKSVVVTVVTSELHFYAQQVEQGPLLEQLLQKIRSHLTSEVPLSGSYIPRIGDICAAKFNVDQQWYRAHIVKTNIKDRHVQVFYIDYGNTEELSLSNIAPLPVDTDGVAPFATEFTLAFVKLPPDDDDKWECETVFRTEMLSGSNCQINVEYQVGSLSYVTLLKDGQDIGKMLIREGLLLVDKRHEKRFQKIMQEYKIAEDDARRDHMNIWRHGDITEDDAIEFGLGR